MVSLLKACALCRGGGLGDSSRMYDLYWVQCYSPCLIKALSSSVTTSESHPLHVHAYYSKRTYPVVVHDGLVAMKPPMVDWNKPCRLSRRSVPCFPTCVSDFAPVGNPCTPAIVPRTGEGRLVGDATSLPPLPPCGRWEEAVHGLQRIPREH